MRKNFKNIRMNAESEINITFQCLIDAVHGKSELEPARWYDDLISTLYFAYMVGIIEKHEYIFLNNAADVIRFGVTP